MFSVGVDNAPFSCSAKVMSRVALCPMTSEYYAAGEVCKDLVHFRQLSKDLGWPSDRPTLLMLDNRTAISLINAPQVSRKSRHIEITFHFIRELAARKTLVVAYVPTKKMRANVLTKYLPKAVFLFERDMLFNRNALLGGFLIE